MGRRMVWTGTVNLPGAIGGQNMPLRTPELEHYLYGTARWPSRTCGPRATPGTAVPMITVD
jgi:hypothetical protein